LQNQKAQGADMSVENEKEKFRSLGGAKCQEEANVEILRRVAA